MFHYLNFSMFQFLPLFFLYIYFNIQLEFFNTVKFYLYWNLEGNKLIDHFIRQIHTNSLIILSNLFFKVVMR